MIYYVAAIITSWFIRKAGGSIISMGTTPVINYIGADPVHKLTTLHHPPAEAGTRGVHKKEALPDSYEYGQDQQLK